DNEQDYHITYQVLGGIRSFEEHDELYWNVTGTDWPVPIQNASATIRLPEGSQEEEALQYQCYTGALGSTQEDCSHDPFSKGEVQFRANHRLNTYQGLTVVFGLPKGILTTPTLLEVHTPPQNVDVFLEGVFHCQ